MARVLELCNAALAHSDTVVPSTRNTSRPQILHGVGTSSSSRAPTRRVIVGSSADGSRARTRQQEPVSGRGRAHRLVAPLAHEWSACRHCAIIAQNTSSGDYRRLRNSRPHRPIRALISASLTSTRNTDNDSRRAPSAIWGNLPPAGTEPPTQTKTAESAPPAT